MNSGLRSIVCAECKCRFAIPIALHEAALCSQNIVFYCPYGHSLSFPKREEEVKVEERDNVVQLHIVKKDNDVG